jgi:hypothetical protein
LQFQKISKLEQKILLPLFEQTEKHTSTCKPSRRMKIQCIKLRLEEGQRNLKMDGFASQKTLKLSFFNLHWIWHGFRYSIYGSSSKQTIVQMQSNQEVSSTKSRKRKFTRIRGRFRLIDFQNDAWVVYICSSSWLFHQVIYLKFTLYSTQKLRLSEGDLEGRFQTSLQAIIMTLLIWKFRSIMYINWSVKLRRE